MLERPRRLLLLHCALLARPGSASAGIHGELGSFDASALVQLQLAHDGSAAGAAQPSEQSNEGSSPPADDWLKEGFTRSHVARHVEQLLISMKDVPRALHDQIANSAAGQIMFWRKHALKRQQRLLFDRLVELHVPAKPGVQGLTDFSRQAADVLQRTGYADAAAKLRSLMPAVGSVVLWHEKLEPLFDRFEAQTQHSKTDYVELARVLREFATEDLSLEWPVLPILRDTVSFIKSNSKALLDLAAVFEAKAKVGQDWVPADELFRELRMPGAPREERAAAEVFLWSADMRRHDLSLVTQLHTTMLMLQDLKAMGVATLTKPQEDFVLSASALTQNETNDMRSLFPLVGVYLDKTLAGRETETTRNLMVVLSWLFKERLKSPNLKDVYNYGLLLYPTAVALNSFDLSDPSAVIPAVADTIFWSSMDSKGDADSQHVFRRMAKALRGITGYRGARRGKNVIPLHTKPMADFLEALAGVVEAKRRGVDAEKLKKLWSLGLTQRRP